jgi:hypothetical protein
MAESFGTDRPSPASLSAALEPLRRILFDAARWWALWALPVSLFLPLRILLDNMSQQPVGIGCLLLDALLETLLWLATTPLLLSMLHRHPLQWPPSGRGLVAHAAAAIGVAIFNGTGHLLGGFWLRQTFQPDQALPSMSELLVLEALYRGPINLILYGAAAAGVSAWQAHLREHARERSLIQARLDALASQIEPHMLFNALNAISEIVYRDAKRADRALCRLGDLLRSLMTRRSSVHSLGEERQLAAQYLSVHEILLGDRLRVAIDVPQDLEHIPVPSLLLQPLVENAVRHARAPRDGALEVLVTARRDLGHLSIEVRNNGATPDVGARGFGLGLRHTRERLAAVYGPSADIHCEFADAGIGRVRVRLPLAGPS